MSHVIFQYVIYLHENQIAQISTIVRFIIYIITNIFSGLQSITQKKQFQPEYFFSSFEKLKNVIGKISGGYNMEI